MKTSRQDWSHKAFILTEEDLRALSGSVGEIGPLRCSVKCTDGLSREFETVEDLLSFDNSPTRAIEALSLSSHSEDWSTSAKVSFENRPLTSVGVQLDGPDKPITNLNSELEARLAGMKPWYAVLTRVEFYFLALAAIFAWVILMLALIAFELVPANSASESAQDPRVVALATLVSYAAIGVTFISIGVLARLRDRLFPVGAFAIAQGKSRHELLEKIRWAVVVGLMVSVLGGAIGSVLV